MFLISIDEEVDSLEYVVDIHNNSQHYYTRKQWYDKEKNQCIISRKTNNGELDDYSFETLERLFNDEKLDRHKFFIERMNGRIHMNNCNK